VDIGCDGGGVRVEGAWLDAEVEEGICVGVDVVGGVEGTERRWGVEGGDGVRHGGEHGGDAHKGRGGSIVSDKDRPPSAGGEVDLEGGVTCFCGVGATDAIGGKIDGTVGTVGVTIAGTQGVAIPLALSTSIKNKPSSPSASSSSSS